MRKPILAILALILASLSCGQYITPTPASIESVTSTVTSQPITQTVTVPTTALSPSVTAQAQTSTIRRALVNVHDATGAVIGQLAEGQTVTVNKCTNNWCEVSTDVISGVVWIGCLDETVNVDNLGCEAR